MSFQADAVETLRTNPIGRLLYRAARPVVLLARRLTHPNIPTNLKLSRVTCLGKPLSIVHRRTYADHQVIAQCFTESQYDMPNGAHGAYIDRIYHQIVATGRKPLIVDCGANIGTSVLWFLTRYPQAHVLAIEPAPDNFALLQRNCAHLNVDLRQAGVAPSDGIAHLTDPGEGTLAYRTHATQAGPEVTMLSMATLLSSKLPALYTPFLLKIDIEGAEKDLFDTDPALINQFPLIIMEPHDWFLPGQQSSVSFFRFHAANGREFSMKHENVASIAYHPRLLEPAAAQKDPHQTAASV
jgi:FkbM family methyltransferase